MTIVTRPACGIPAAPILAAVAVILKTISGRYKETSSGILLLIQFLIVIKMKEFSPDCDYIYKRE